MLFGGSRFRRFSDVPLAHLIGRTAKRAMEIGAPSLKHPFARVFTEIVATSPLANSKWCNVVHLHRKTKILTRSAVSTCLETTIERQAHLTATA
jgi:hypothetical protein